MKKLNNIKVIAFDYGGTLDLPGIHWFNFLWNIVSTKLAAKISVTKEEFWDAYVYGERKLEGDPIPADTDLFNNLLIKSRYEIEYLVNNIKNISIGNADELENVAFTLASTVTDIIINGNYPESRHILSELHNKYDIYIVSNYYGNLKTILEEAGFIPYISKFFDSTTVGIRKPDPGIWQLAIDASGLNAQQILVVGDSMKNDIAPAKSLGCQTAWLTNEPTDDYEGIVITKLADLPGLL